MNHMVVECRPGYAVVLGDDGRFRKVANLRYEVGQTVANVVEAELPERHTAPASGRRWLTALSAAAACLVLVLTSVLFGMQMPYASVYLTINPEVRIDVSRNDTVLNVEGMNGDGKALLNGYDHRRKVLDTVMDELVDRAIDMDYLSEGGKVTISLDAEDDEWVVSHSDHLNRHLSDHLADSITITVEVTQKPKEETSPTAPAETIVIPIGPEHYGDSAYGETTAPVRPTVPAAPAGDESDYGDTDYAAVPGSDGDSGYGDVPDDDGDSGYGDVPDDDGDSGYGEIPDDDGDTDYETAPDDDGDTDYETVPDDDGDSNYESAPDEDGDTDYGDAPVDDGDSEYEEVPDADEETSDDGGEEETDYDD